MAGSPKSQTAAARLIGLFVVLALAPSLASAGEIYGRVSQDGKVKANASVSISCPSTGSRSARTDSKGVYRIAGPSREEKCTIKVNGSNAVTIFASSGRSRANLELRNGKLIRR